MKIVKICGPCDGKRLFAAARTWLNTPYQHAQRVKGVGVDCVGLVLAAAEEAGLFDPADWDVPTQYSPWVNAAQLQAQIDRFLRPLRDKEPLQSGDVLLLDIDGSAQHVAIYGEPRPGRPRATIVHASLSVGRVIEHGYERFWEDRTVARYRLRRRAPQEPADG